MVNKTKMGGLKQNIRLGVGVKNSTQKKKEEIGTKKGLKQNNRINIESPNPQKKAVLEFVKSVIDKAVTKVKGTATPNATTDATVKARSDNNAVMEISQDKKNEEKKAREKNNNEMLVIKEKSKKLLNDRLIVRKNVAEAKKLAATQNAQNKNKNQKRLSLVYQQGSDFQKEHNEEVIQRAIQNRNAHELQKKAKQTNVNNTVNFTGFTGGKTKKNTNKRTSRNNKPSKKNKTRRK
jgi:hypothetical protein